MRFAPVLRRPQAGRLLIRLLLVGVVCSLPMIAGATCSISELLDLVSNNDGNSPGVVDSDGDGVSDDADGCPSDPAKTSPGACGCGVSDADTDGDGTPDCDDACPEDPDKIEPGECGCGSPDVDTDGDGVLDCDDRCPEDPLKTGPGLCGCGERDTDRDHDGVPDCDDRCPDDPNKATPERCGCNEIETAACVNAYMYWSWSELHGPRGIRRSRFDGTSVQDVYTTYVAEASVNDIVIDQPNGKVYWTLYISTRSGRIMRANLDGSDVESLVTDLSIVHQLVLDPVESKLYWTEAGAANRVARANLDGSNVETVVLGLTDPRAIALDPGQRNLYWADAGSEEAPATIQTVNLNTTTRVRTLVVSSAGGIPGGMEFDMKSGRLYWSDAGANVIQRVDASGETLDTLLSNVSAGDMVLDAPRGKLYWTGTNKTETEIDGIWRAGLNGGGVERAIPLGSAAKHIAILIEP